MAHPPKLLCGGLLSGLALLAALWYRPAPEDTLQIRIDTVLSSLLRAEGKVELDGLPPPRVAIGFGGCLDIIVNGVELLDEADIEYSRNPVHHDVIQTEKQLAESFAYFFPPGAASERYVSNATLFRKLVNASKKLSEMRWSLGGNAAVMANRLAREGCDVLLGGRFSREQSKSFSQNVTVAGDLVEDADIHLILEYATGSRWGDYISRRANSSWKYQEVRASSLMVSSSPASKTKTCTTIQAQAARKHTNQEINQCFVHDPGHKTNSQNQSEADMRYHVLTNEKEENKSDNKANQLYIVHSDVHNPMIDSLEEFKLQLSSFRPNVLVIGGLQMMDNFPFEAGQRSARLKALQDLLISTDPSTGTHFEMASFVEESLMKDLLQYVIPYADSLGMNEQELPNLLSLMKGGNITVLSDPYPRVASILDQMRELYRLVNSQELKKGYRKLTRLHIHTLAFQAIAVSKGSMWKNTMSATAKASLTANRHVCGSAQIDTTKARLILDDSFSVSREIGSTRIPVKETRPVSCWEESDFEICIAPVLVCTQVYQTAGGGDNVSAAGLVLQI